ncbi:hypothetical protein CDAR_541241 [Caerostris darwini]|uniref:Uncharacterized protein n=1 Tax=Caerostris darwini TaxID=1538125 RepID=A0AAV4SDZ8_9ARAC|nr:hypothetical protein CDAR_541241 [Caerostris darwini]
MEKTGRPSPIQWQKCEISYPRKFILFIDSKSLRGVLREVFFGHNRPFNMRRRKSSCAGDVPGNFSLDNFRFEFAWGLQVVDIIFGFLVRKLKATGNSCCVGF